MKKTALVTGAAGGIGFELAKIAYQKGYHVLMVDVDAGNVQKACDRLNSEATRAESFQQDLSKPEAAQILFDHCQSNSLEVDMLINNAGFGNFGYFTQTSWEKDLAMLHVHVITATELMKKFLPIMQKNGKGYIMNVASVAAFMPGPLMSTYHASKSYLLNLSQALSNEVKTDGIHISVLCPGMTKTNFAKANGNENPNIKFNIADSASVAKYGFSGVLKGKAVLVPGIWNQLSVFLPRLLSKNRVTNMVGNIQRKNHAKRQDDKAIKA